MLGINISATEERLSTNRSKNHVSAARFDELGGLVPAAEEEDIWTSNNGEE